MICIQFIGNALASCTIINELVPGSIARSKSHGIKKKNFLSTGGRNIDLGVRIDTTNISSAFVECTFFQPGYTCTIDYGTGPSYTNLIYRDTSFTQGRQTTITLSQRLRGDTTYHYIVSAVSSSQCVRVQGRFRAGR